MPALQLINARLRLDLLRRPPLRNRTGRVRARPAAAGIHRQSDRRLSERARPRAHGRSRRRRRGRRTGAVSHCPTRRPAPSMRCARSWRASAFVDRVTAGDSGRDPAAGSRRTQPATTCASSTYIWCGGRPARRTRRARLRLRAAAAARGAPGALPRPARRACRTQLRRRAVLRSAAAGRAVARRQRQSAGSFAELLPGRRECRTDRSCPTTNCRRWSRSR